MSEQKDGPEIIDEQRLQALRTAAETQKKELIRVGYPQALQGWHAAIRSLYGVEDLPEVQECLCLALGRLDQAQNSLRQLAALQDFLKTFSLHPADTKCHDPWFSAEDKALLEEMGFAIPQNAAEARKQLRLDKPTLFVTFFLPFPVIEQLFRENWSPQRLGNIIMIGCRLEGWLDDENWLKHLDGPSAPRVRRALPLFETIKLPSVAALMRKAHEVSNATSEPMEIDLDRFELQWIPPARLTAMGKEFWRIRPQRDSGWSHLRPIKEVAAKTEKAKL